MGPYFEVEPFFALLLVRFFRLLEVEVFGFAAVVFRLRDELDRDFLAEAREPALLRALVAEEFVAFARGDFFAFRDVVPLAGMLFPPYCRSKVNW